MDQNIKDYADSAYEMSMVNSVSSLRKAKAALLTEIATRSGGLPANMARIASIHVDHVQRCISARLESYQMAFSDAGVTPSESDFKQMYTEATAATITISGGDLKGPIQITDPTILSDFTVWTSREAVRPNRARTHELSWRLTATAPLFEMWRKSIDSSGRLE